MATAGNTKTSQEPSTHSGATVRWSWEPSKLQEQKLLLPLLTVLTGHESQESATRTEHAISRNNSEQDCGEQSCDSDEERLLSGTLTRKMMIQKSQPLQFASRQILEQFDGNLEVVDDAAA